MRRPVLSLLLPLVLAVGVATDAVAQTVVTATPNVLYEGETNTVSVTVTFPNVAATLSYYSVYGTATHFNFNDCSFKFHSTQDFCFDQDAVVIDQGADTATLSITVFGDTRTEGDETIILGFQDTNSTDYVATITIKDGFPPPPPPTACSASDGSKPTVCFSSSRTGRRPAPLPMTTPCRTPGWRALGARWRPTPRTPSAPGCAPRRLPEMTRM